MRGKGESLENASEDGKLTDSWLFASSKNLMTYSFKNHSMCYLIKSQFFMGNFSTQFSVAMRSQIFLSNVVIKSSSKHGTDWPKRTGRFTMGILARSAVYNMNLALNTCFSISLFFIPTVSWYISTLISPNNDFSLPYTDSLLVNV